MEPARNRGSPMGIRRRRPLRARGAIALLFLRVTRVMRRCRGREAVAAAARVPCYSLRCIAPVKHDICAGFYTLPTLTPPPTLKEPAHGPPRESPFVLFLSSLPRASKLAAGIYTQPLNSIHFSSLLFCPRAVVSAVLDAPPCGGC